MILKTFFLVVTMSALGLQSAFAASALGLSTDEWTNPSAEMVAQVEAMEAAMAAMAKGEKPAVELQDAIDKIRELADKGEDKDALFAMGFLIQQSNQQNALPEAMTFYEKASKLGQLQAMNNYGFILAGSAQELEKTQDGVGYIKRAADGGLNAARRNMAAIYLGGLAGETKDADLALELLNKAAAENDNQAMFELAQYYLELGGPEKVDDDKAWEWLNKAADSGNPNALASLGSVLFDGKTFGARKIEADPAKAVATFSKLADQGVPAGLRTMGELHASGLAGVPQDFTKALDFFTRAAQANDPAAQVVLAGYYDQGVDVNPEDGKVDVTPNPAAALELYRLAARNNVPVALYSVGVFYETGRSVDQDPAKAFAFYLQAAGGGFAPAMQKAGVYYLNGTGTLKDPIAASGWFSRAAAAGLPEGLLSLGVMAESGLVGVGPESTPAKAASDAYAQVIAVPQIAPATRFEALLRLGGLHFRGALTAAGEAPSPNYEQAYRYFKQAANLAPENELATSALKETTVKLTPEQIKTIDDSLAETVAAAPVVLAPPAAATDSKGKGKGEVAAPVAMPVDGATAPAPAGATPATDEKKPGFRLPLFGR
jgi:TPR repeat protein